MRPTPPTAACGEVHRDPTPRVTNARRLDRAHPRASRPQEFEARGMRQDALAETRHANTLCSTPPEALCANVLRCILNLSPSFHQTVPGCSSQNFQLSPPALWHNLRSRP